MSESPPPSSWITVSSPPKKKPHLELAAAAKDDTVVGERRGTVDRMGSTKHVHNGPPAWMNEIEVQPAPPNFHSPNEARRMILLVGLPGSGKSTLAECLCRVQPWKFVRVNQDELKTRPKCITMATRVLRNHQVPIIDRCHTSRVQRGYFIDLAASLHRTTDTPVMVDVICLQAASVETCTRRCHSRAHHPTLRGPNVSGVVCGMQADWQTPQTNEGVRSVTMVSDEATLQAVVWELLQEADTATK